MHAFQMDPATRSDESLVDDARRGVAGAFEALVERHQERIFRLVRHYARQPAEIEDLAQDTFLKAFRRLDSFEGQSSFATWLHRIAVNTCLDALKRKSRSPVMAAEDPEALAVEGRGVGPSIAAPDAGLEREEIARVTRAALERLPEIFRTVLVLREFEDLSYQEMADTLGISIGTIESRLFRARARFRQALIDLHPEYADPASEERAREGRRAAREDAKRRGEATR